MDFWLMAFCFMMKKDQVPFKYKIFRSDYVTLVLRRAYLAITNLPMPLGLDDVYVPIRHMSYHSL